MFWFGFLALMIVGALAGCEKVATESPDVSDSIRKSLDQAGLKDVSVSQDRDKGVVTLGGLVTADAGKSTAESIAKAIVAGQVVADQEPKGNLVELRTGTRIVSFPWEPDR